MFQIRPGTLPFLLGACLPWQTVFIIEKINEFTAIQIFWWQGFIFLWWLARGCPGWRTLLMAGTPLVAISLFSLFPGFSLWHVGTLGLAGALYFLVSAFTPAEKLSWTQGLAVGLVPLALLSLFQVAAGGSPASTLLGLTERSAERLGESVVIIAGERVLRAYGSFPHPNILAAWAVMMTVLSVATRDPWRRGLIVLSLILLGLTLSRAGFLAALILLILIFIPKYTWRLAWGLCLLTLGLTFLTPKLIAAVRGGGSLEDRSLNERRTQLVETGRLLSQPKILLLGTGSGTSTATRMLTEPGLPPYAYQPVHNTFILILLELGLPLGLFFGLYVFNKRSSFPPTLALMLPFLFFDHFLWTTAIGPVIVAVLSTLDWRLLKGKIEP
jgi:hypothetical protein